MDASVQTKARVLSLIEEHKEKLKTLGVKKLGLFGSFVYEEHHAKSDIDLLVEFEQGQKTFDNFIGLSFLLEDLFKRPVELVTPESLSPYIGPHILREVEYVTFIVNKVPMLQQAIQRIIEAEADT
jgi:predicted nucleotidyltransferase